MSLKKVEKVEFVKKTNLLCTQRFCDVCGNRIYSTKDIGNRLQKAEGTKTYYKVECWSVNDELRCYDICDNGCIFNFISDKLDSLASGIVRSGRITIFKEHETDYGEWVDDGENVSIESEADFI